MAQPLSSQYEIHSYILEHYRLWECFHSGDIVLGMPHIPPNQITSALYNLNGKRGVLLAELCPKELPGNLRIRYTLVDVKARPLKRAKPKAHHKNRIPGYGKNSCKQLDLGLAPVQTKATFFWRVWNPTKATGFFVLDPAILPDLEYLKSQGYELVKYSPSTGTV